MGIEDLDRLDAQFQAETPATGGSFEPIPADTKVIVVVQSQKPQLVGGNKTPCCKPVFVVQSPEQYVNKKIWHDFWITEANLKYLKRDLIVLGWLLPDGKARDGYKLTRLMNPDDTSLIGLGAEVTVGIEPYVYVDPETGMESTRTKNTIKFFNAPYKPAANPQKPVAGAAAAGAAPASKPGTQDDDAIPF